MPGSTVMILEKNVKSFKKGALFPALGVLFFVSGVLATSDKSTTDNSSLAGWLGAMGTTVVGAAFTVLVLAPESWKLSKKYALIVANIGVISMFVSDVFVSKKYSALVNSLKVMKDVAFFTHLMALLIMLTKENEPKVLVGVAKSSFVVAVVCMGALTFSKDEFFTSIENALEFTITSLATGCAALELIDMARLCRPSEALPFQERLVSGVQPEPGVEPVVVS